jgi:single-stranded-DNA-specific exonuclease
VSVLPSIVHRTAAAGAIERLIASGCDALLARLYAARGLTAPSDLDHAFARLHPPAALRNIGIMAQRLAEAITARERIVIVADYDTDGATACAVGLRALRAFGADVRYLVPRRFDYGYGLTPEVVRLAHARFQPHVLVTVDNGISSIEGAAEARRLGMQTLVTDHHLPGERLPDAACIVNPNQPGCEFPSKHLAGVGVIFYVMLALRAELRRRGAFEREPPLAGLTDLVALGTVADLVRLDANNRILVAQGLRRIRAGRTQPGIAALFRAAGRDPAHATVHDLGFVLGPRINAAGRLDDMTIGIECLTTDEPHRAAALAGELDRLNRERREIEARMQDDALAALESTAHDACAVSLYDPQWHQGVVGLVASRMKERLHRPVIAFAHGGGAEELKGSGRSIPGLHLRDALDLVAKRYPGLLLGFGGHAAAAGVVIRRPDLPAFRIAFEETVRALLTPADLEEQIEIDGSLEPEYVNYPCAVRLREAVWGQGFPEPRFLDTFRVLSQRTLGARHTKSRIRRAGREFDALLFNACGPLPDRIDAVYRLDLNEYGGTRGLQLTLEHWQPAAGGPL